MSKSFRDAERRSFKTKYHDMLDAFNEGSPDTAKKVRDCRETKEVLRDGNKRKANALLKVKGRRTERKRLNIVKIEE